MDERKLVLLKMLLKLRTPLNVQFFLAKKR